ncbi:MAG: cation:proton antiporter [Saprospiraceae bacterium]|nr:cation:proton antiporter [Saprospiraceae bacterium]MCF8249118.1 cation:proton antiporter [Saprospiraceae bacterium]MCF8281375.1 cation:proton antiporter [Bacteroidales bacterium]MCF8311140.1 cation:proton antiporter [Saprospiraceae bacterium]MCF8440230.1 cation:proton antiporter [Saprospiraceae bacterium]
MEILTSYNLIIEASVIIILSFIFGEIARKTNVPAVLMLIALGIGMKFGLDALGLGHLNFFPILEILGIVGLIMIVLEAALELELKPEKLKPILMAMLIALIGLLASAWAAAAILQYYMPEMSTVQAWLYATPLSILSSAIIIPSVSGLKSHKKEFHIYESTFSDILGIMLFYFVSGQVDIGDGAHSSGVAGFFGNLGLTIAIALVASYGIVLIFQNIKSHIKLFLLISVLLLLYALGKKMHLSSLIIILVFGLVIANMKLFFRGKLAQWLHLEKAANIYEGLHVVTGETAFVVRTFFFVIFGLTISLASLASGQVAIISGLIVLSIYAIRWVLLRLFIGKDILPQLFIAPRGLITVLLFYAIPVQAQVEGFEAGILLFIIIATSLIMTFAMVWDKRRTGQAVQKAKNLSVGYAKWKAPAVETEEEDRRPTY